MVNLYLKKRLFAESKINTVFWKIGSWKVHVLYLKSFNIYLANDAISVSSCTTGMQLFYQVIGVSKGDEVIVSSQTHVATAHAIESYGAKPVFIDSELNSGNLNTLVILKKK